MGHRPLLVNDQPGYTLRTMDGNNTKVFLAIGMAVFAVIIVVLILI